MRLRLVGGEAGWPSRQSGVFSGQDRRDSLDPGTLSKPLTVGDLMALARMVAHTLRMDRAKADVFTEAEPSAVTAPETIDRLTSALNEWESHLRAKNRDEKYITQSRRAVRTLFESAGTTDPTQVRGMHIEKHRDDLCLAEASGSQVNNRLAAIRQFFKWAVRFEVLNHNPAKEVENVERHDGDGNREFVPTEAASMVRVAREDEAKPKPQHRAIRSPAYVIAWNTGLRSCELSRLVWADARGIGTSDPYLEMSWKKTKNRRAVQISLNEEAATELAKWLPLVKDNRDKMFPTRRTPGMPQLPHDRVVDRDIAAAGIQKIDEYGAPVGMHSFRKGAATVLAEAGAPELKVAQFLRHSDPKLTRKIYVRLRRGQMRTVACAVPSVDNRGEKEPAPKKSTQNVDKEINLGDTTASQVRTMQPNQTHLGLSIPGALAASGPEKLDPTRPGSVSRESLSGSRDLHDLPTSAIEGEGWSDDAFFRDPETGRMDAGLRQALGWGLGSTGG